MDMELQEVENEIILMSMLASNVEYTIKDIAYKMHRTPSTVYRHIKTLKEKQFIIKRLRRGVYELVTIPRELSEFKNLVYFTEEEAFILHGIISSLDNTNELKTGLMKKLAAIYGCSNLAEFVYRKESSRDISRLREAIEHKKKVVLRNYSSSNSGSVRNRLVEPFRIKENYAEIWAYDLEAGRNKIFRIARIGEVEILDERWTEERRHAEEEADCFRCYGTEWDRIILKLDTRAKNLLVEEFPMARKDLKAKGTGWIFDTRVRSMKGIGRFVLGVGTDIEIIMGEPLKEYILNYMDDIKKLLN